MLPLSSMQLTILFSGVLVCFPISSLFLMLWFSNLSIAFRRKQGYRFTIFSCSVICLPCLHPTEVLKNCIRSKEFSKIVGKKLSDARTIFLYLHLYSNIVVWGSSMLQLPMLTNGSIWLWILYLPESMF